MIEIRNLQVTAGGKKILNGVNLKVGRGEIAVIFGPNGCGKTTLLNSIMGLSKYKVESGQIIFKRKAINDWPVERRAKEGVGLLWQKPPKISGVNLANVLLATQSINKDDKSGDIFNIDRFLERGINDDLSGGETKRSEMAQLSVQNPDTILLDEPDSGVDVDNGKLIAKAIEGWRKKGKSILLVTHNGNLLKYLTAQKSYVMLDGQIRCQGKPKEMFETIAKCGYQKCIDCRRRAK
jgi:Fe-S cluster assembly ATP-binding protein